MNLPVGVLAHGESSSSTTVGPSHPHLQPLNFRSRRGPGRLLGGLLGACFSRNRCHGQPQPHQPIACQKSTTPFTGQDLAVHTRKSAGALCKAGATRNGHNVSHVSSTKQQHAARQSTFLSSLVRTLGRMVRGLGRAVSPKGPGDNDASVLERVLNVLTCIPFFIVGQSFVRQPPSTHFARFGQAMRIVGVVASAYHASSGKPRHVLRKADYWTIAVASARLRRAVVGPLSLVPALCMSVLIPLKPTLVTTANLVAVEVTCLASVLSSASSDLVMSWVQHAAVSVAAVVSFGMEGKLSGSALGPFVHASWHCLAAAGMLTTGMLLRTTLPMVEASC